MVVRPDGTHVLPVQNKICQNHFFKIQFLSLKNLREQMFFLFYGTAVFEFCTTAHRIGSGTVQSAQRLKRVLDEIDTIPAEITIGRTLQSDFFRSFTAEQCGKGGTSGGGGITCFIFFLLRQFFAAKRTDPDNFGDFPAVHDIFLFGKGFFVTEGALHLRFLRLAGDSGMSMILPFSASAHTPEVLSKSPRNNASASGSSMRCSTARRSGRAPYSGS